MKNEPTVDLISEMKPYVDQFLKEIPPLSQRTQTGYRYIIDSFLSFLENHLAGKGFPAKFKRVTFVAWLKFRESRLNSLRTVQSDALVISRFLAFLDKEKVLKHNSVAILQKHYPRNGLGGIVAALLGPSTKESLLALKREQPFVSPLGDAMKAFIALGRSQGKRYQNEEEILCRFDRFLMSYSQRPLCLSDSMVEQWINLSRNCLPSTRQLNFAVVRRFCLYQRRMNPSAYVPETSLIAFKSSALLPYVYSRTQITAILTVARELPSPTLSPIRAQMYYLLFLLLYTTGMRISEALALEIRDIHWNNPSLHIRESKFYKSRLLPISASVAVELKNYLRYRGMAGLASDDNAPLFQNPHSVSHLSKSAVTTTFREILCQLNIKATVGRKSPCIHSLRHTMAVHRLEYWYTDGVDVQAKLQLLSTYLDHIKISSTQRYLTMTAEMLEQASECFKRYSTAN